MNIDISGEWIGSIVYGKQYLTVEGEILFFEIILSRDNDRITGESRDISGKGKNDSVADIIGEFNQESGHLDFIKTYEKVARYSHKGQIKSFVKNVNSKIYYTGLFNEKLQKFEGTWKIRRKRKFLFFDFGYSIGEGTWSMKRKV